MNGKPPATSTCPSPSCEPCGAARSVSGVVGGTVASLTGWRTIHRLSAVDSMVLGWNESRWTRMARYSPKPLPLDRGARGRPLRYSGVTPAQMMGWILAITGAGRSGMARSITRATCRSLSAGAWVTRGILQPLLRLRSPVVLQNVVAVAVACSRASVRFSDGAEVVDFTATTPMERYDYPTQIPRTKPAVPFAVVDAAYESASIIANAQARQSAVDLARGRGQLAPKPLERM